MKEMPASEFTIGVEEELHLVDPESHRLAPIAADVLARLDLPDGRAGHESYAAQVELRTPPCADASEIRAALAKNREAASAAGATLMGVGLHPTAAWGEADIVDEPRYHEIGAVDARRVRPHAGGRTPRARRDARRGDDDPRVQRDAASPSAPDRAGRELPLVVRARLRAGQRAPGGRALLPGPRNTAGLRELGSLPGPPEARGGVGRTVRLHAHLVGRPPAPALRDGGGPRAGRAVLGSRTRRRSPRSRRRSRGGRPKAPGAELPPAEAIDWACFRAARDGLDAEVLHEGRLTPVREAARELAAALDVPEVEELVARGGGAARRREAHARGGTEEMLRDLVAETAP